MKQYKTIVISDLHLGIKASKAKEAYKFLKNNSCETLILNGDIIDGWQLKKSGKWKKKHSKFFKLILKIMSDKNMQVIYLRGNHDDFLDEIMPFEIGNFKLRRQFILNSGANKYLVIHGDIFDSITSNLSWLSKLGDVGYTLLLWINRHYNHIRQKRGKDYYSLSAIIKNKVKKVVNLISDYEKKLTQLANEKGCNGIICGHIHQADNKMIGDIHYLNSGDWVESMTALVETHSNHWEIIDYVTWNKAHKLKKEQKSKIEDLSSKQLNSSLLNKAS
jgi:UDP-2,3-diacylglucosamine pyrophosphatase LpxH